MSIDFTKISEFTVEAKDWNEVNDLVKKFAQTHYIHHMRSRYDNSTTFGIEFNRIDL